MEENKPVGTMPFSATYKQVIENMQNIKKLLGQVGDLDKDLENLEKILGGQIVCSDEQPPDDAQRTGDLWIGPLSITENLGYLDGLYPPVRALPINDYTLELMSVIDLDTGSVTQAIGAEVRFDDI